jgi:hypothetical protein
MGLDRFQSDQSAGIAVAGPRERRKLRPEVPHISFDGWNRFPLWSTRQMTFPSGWVTGPLRMLILVLAADFHKWPDRLGWIGGSRGFILPP